MLEWIRISDVVINHSWPTAFVIILLYTFHYFCRTMHWIRYGEIEILSYSVCPYHVTLTSRFGNIASRISKLTLRFKFITHISSLFIIFKVNLKYCSFTWCTRQLIIISFNVGNIMNTSFKHNLRYCKTLSLKIILFGT